MVTTQLVEAEFMTQNLRIKKYLRRREVPIICEPLYVKETEKGTLKIQN